VTINTDNRLVTNTTVSKELWVCHTKMGMSLSDIKSMIVGGFKSAFLPFHVKQAMLRQVSDDLDRFHSDGTVDPEKAALVSSKKPVHSSKPVEATFDG